MSTTETPGFQIGGKFYPFVSIEQWTRGDSILVHTLTRLGDELFDGNHTVELQSAFVAVAMAHKDPGVKHDQIISRVSQLGLGAVEEVGFPTDDEEPEGDARPPDEDSTASNSSPESGADSSGDSS